MPPIRIAPVLVLATRIAPLLVQGKAPETGPDPKQLANATTRGARS